MEKFARLFVLLTILVTGVNAFSIRHWAAELNRNFSAYYSVGILLSLLFAIFFSRAWGRRVAVLLVIVLSFLLAPSIRALWPFYAESPLDSANRLEACDFTVATVNVGVPAHAKLLSQWLDQEQPDIVAIIEWVPEISTNLNLSSRYLFRAEVPAETAHGLAVASRFPFVGEPHYEIGEELYPIVRVKVAACGTKEFSLTALHAMPPFTDLGYHMNQLLFRRVGLFYRNQEKGPAMVVGDFNATPFSDLYGRIPVAAGFDSVFTGFGIPVTWSARMQLARFALDHILVRGQFSVLDASVGQDIGSDHFPVKAKVRLSTSPGECYDVDGTCSGFY